MITKTGIEPVEITVMTRSRESWGSWQGSRGWERGGCKEAEKE